MKGRQATARGAAGFTITELTVAIGLILVMGAVAVPSLFAFIRNYSIDASAKEMASEIRAARYKAISRNVNLGVLFVVLDDESYRYVIEDDLEPQTLPNWTTTQTLPFLLTRSDQLSPVKRLPTGIRFQRVGDSTDPFFRFNRFGAWCRPNVDPGCPDVSGFTGIEYVANHITGATLRILQDDTGLARTIRVGTEGRVVIENK